MAVVGALALGWSAAAVPAPAGAQPGPTLRTVAIRWHDGHPQVVRGQVPASGRLAAAAGVEPDRRVATFASSPDPLRPQEWGLTRLRMWKPWKVSRGAGIVVAVVDSGVAADHEDLVGAVLPGIDLVAPRNRSNGGTDPNGHGTHVAGIIAARLRNGVGGAGVANRAQILPVRVLDEFGGGWTSDVAEGVIWATDQGADVINLSLGGPAPSDAMREAIRYAVSQGVVVVSAAGNTAESGNPAIYPAAYADTIAVAAIDDGSRRASFSSYGRYVDLAAPGVDIVSTYGGEASNDYAWMSGTSMAAPHVAGVVALMRSADPSLTPGQIAARLTRTAIDLGKPGADWRFGAGLVNPVRAVRLPPPPPPPPPEPPPPPPASS